MQQIRPFVDDRVGNCCAYCAGVPDTRDHVPSRVLLDEPYPENLPVVPCCASCNASFSLDEEYLACVVDCVIAGTTEPGSVQRQKVRRLLTARPALRRRIAQSRVEGLTGLVWEPEAARVEHVLLKLARGHAAFDLGEPQYRDPDRVAFMPLAKLDAQTREVFETVPHAHLWPEVGSRAMQRMAETLSSPAWIDVQPGRYRYLATVEGGVLIRVVLSEYLAGEVRWR